MKRFLLAATVVTLIGCTAPIKHAGTRSLGQEHIYKRTYTVGAAKTVNVGEPMLRVEDYWVEKFEEPVAVPNKSFVMTGGPVRMEYRGGEQYDIRGTIAVDGVDYAVVPSEKRPTYQAALVHPSGAIYNRVVATPNTSGDHVMVVWTMQVDPPDAKMERQTGVKVNSTKGFVNYELIYTGANASGLNLTYREFSPDGLARPAFFQNLTYPADAKTITFKQLKLAVEQANAESITFTVLQD